MRILITGASNGIGLELAQSLRSEMEMEVWAVCRNREKGATLESQGMRVFYADLGDLDQTRRLAEDVMEAGGVDVLINNAGMPLTKRVEGGVNKTLIVNLISPYVLAHALLSNEKVSKVVNLSSVTHWSGELVTSANANDPHADHYANSKCSMMAMSILLEREFNWAEIVTFNPGYVDTGIWHPKAPGEMVHKYMRQLFALKPNEMVDIFRAVVTNSYTSHVYLSPYRETVVMRWLRMLSPRLMLLNDLLGKRLLLSTKPELTDINPNCYETRELGIFLSQYESPRA